jgi:copper chaperone CopZ
MVHTYNVTGMHCKNCVEKTTAALRSVPGVSSAEVTLDPPHARVEMARHVPTEILDQAVRAAGNYRLSEPQPTAEQTVETVEQKESLYPLFLIVGYIAGTVGIIALATAHGSIQVAMRHFMAGFFLVFSFFKLLDLRGFTDTYRSYDILARAWPSWALIYPFVELALGIAYLVNFNPLLSNLATLLIMVVGAVGVFKALLNKQAIRCACLGTVLNLPMTKVTLVEDLTMGAMAGAMLIMQAS